MLSNRLEKIANHQAGLASFSDHTVQILTRNSKPIKTTQKYIRTRSFKNFNRQQYKENILNHPNYIEVLYDGDSDSITQKIQKIVNDSLQDMAPIQTIQISNKNQVRLSEEVRDKMVQRDLALVKYKKLETLATKLSIKT